MSQLAARWADRAAIHLITWSDVASDTYMVPNCVVRHGLGQVATSSSLWEGMRANWKRVRLLRHKLREIDPHWILSFSDQMNIVGLEAARGLGVPMWIAEHSDPAKQRLSTLWELWRRRSYPACRGCVALTPAIAETLARWIPAARLRVIPPAVSLPAGQRFDVLSHAADSRPPAVKTVFFLGRLSVEKGVDVLLEAWSQLAPRLPDWQLVIAGDGPQRHMLTARLAALDRVQFLGWLPEPWDRLSTCDLFVLPSRYEGFPVALLEAMSLARPAVVTRCSSAIPLLLSTGQCLIDVPVNDPASLAQGIYSACTDRSLRVRLSENGFQVAGHYTWEKIGPMWDALLPHARKAS
jgi:glycosyltransferase involved in cell wall biosynthesis